MLPDNPDAIARLIYLAVLLAALAFFMLGGGHRIGKAVRDLAIWGLIFATIVVLYGFRDVLQRELSSETAVTLSDNSVELRRSPDGHFWWRAEVNGRSVRFIVDTGATGIVLTQSDAQAAGIDTGGLSYQGRALTANGPVSTAEVRLDSLVFGPFSDRNVVANVTSGDQRASLLGMDYLNRFESIEIRGDRMRLLR